MPKTHLMKEYTDKIKGIKYHRVFFDERTGDFDIQVIECEHDFHLVQKTIKGGATQIRNQCKKCGELVGGAKSQKNLKLWKIPKAIEITNTWEDFTKERQRLIERLESAKQKIRDTYYKSPEWSKKWALVMARDGEVCQACQDEPATQVHHLSYRHFKNEPLFDLVAVCKACHTSIHKMEKGENYTPIKHD